LLGKKGSLTLLKTRLGSLATVDEKKAAGQALNAATQAVSRRSALGARSSVGPSDRRAARAERIDLTEELTAAAPRATRTS
jgi:phenylalanyl-tRNA synthetase alpha chain